MASAADCGFSMQLKPGRAGRAAGYSEGVKGGEAVRRMEGGGVPTPFALKLPRSDSANEEAPAWLPPSQPRPRAPSHSLLVFAQSSCQHFLEAQGMPLLLPGDTLWECLKKKKKKIGLIKHFLQYNRCYMCSAVKVNKTTVRDIA